MTVTQLTQEERTGMVSQRVALVTGGTGGIGAAICRRLASEGASIAAGYWHQPERAAKSQAAMAADHPGQRFTVHEGNIGSADDCRRVVHDVIEQHGRLDVLVNNAGIASGGPMVDTTMEEWRELLEINLLSVVRGCRAFLPGMLERRRGRILNTASFAGLAGAPSMMTYGVSKAAVVALSEQLRAEVHGTGVTVSVACPAFFQTNLLENFRGSERMKGFADKMMTGGKDKLDEVADKIFAATERGRFLILPTRNEPKYWRMKRWFPEKYFHKLVEAVAKRAKK